MDNMVHILIEMLYDTIEEDYSSIENWETLIGDTYAGSSEYDEIIDLLYAAQHRKDMLYAQEVLS